MGKGVKWAGLNPSKVTFWPCVMGCKNGREDKVKKAHAIGYGLRVSSCLLSSCCLQYFSELVVVNQLFIFLYAFSSYLLTPEVMTPSPCYSSRQAWCSLNPLVTKSILNCVFSFLTLQPNSTNNFITISFKQTLAESPASLLSREKIKTCLSLLKCFWPIFNYKKSEHCKTQLKIKMHLLLITQERVEILQKIQQF